MALGDGASSPGSDQAQVYWLKGYRGGYRWYRARARGMTAWAWGLHRGRQAYTSNRGDGGGGPCDPNRPNCNQHEGTPPTTSPPPVPPSSGAAISVFPVRGRHWAWNKQPCGYNDYYHGAGGTNHASGHLGNDIFGAIGTPMVSPVTGVVARAGYAGSIGGNRVTIRRGSCYFYHAHMKRIARASFPVRGLVPGRSSGPWGRRGRPAPPRPTFTSPSIPTTATAAA